MGSQLQVNDDVDALSEILEQDAKIHNSDRVSTNFCYAIHQLHDSFEATAFVETTETEVIITVRIPRI
jgi:hypothetical protein